MATQITALSRTHAQFQDAEVSSLKRKLKEAVLDVERARMTTEDARGQEREKRQRINSTISDLADATDLVIRDLRRAADTLTTAETTLEAEMTVAAYAHGVY